MDIQVKEEFKGMRVCFFSTVPKEKLQFENYSIQDLRILKELGFEVIVANTFGSIPWNCDLYFSWWASGSVLPLVKAIISRKPIITIAGGNEVMLYKDSVNGKPAGYLNYPLWKKIAIRLTLKFTDRLLVVSKFMVADVQRLGNKNPIVVHNCVDTAIFCSRGDKRRYITSIFKIDENTVLLKRGEVFLKAIAKVVRDYPNQKFAIIGKKGNYFDHFFAMAKELKICGNIEFIDEIANEDVLNWIQDTLLYVQISDTETFGLAIAEAMSCEVPVLVSRCGAIPEIVGSNGLYVDHNSPESVANGILEFLKMEQSVIKEIGLNMRARVIDNFSYSKRKEKITEIIKSLK